jgi:hypothetical protein
MAPPESARAAAGAPPSARAPDAGPSLPPAPASVLDPRGAPRLGAFEGEIERAEEIARAAGAGGPLSVARWKRWVYAFVGGPRALCGFAVADVGYLGQVFGYAYDRERGGEKLEVGWLAPLAVGVRVAGGLSNAAAAGAAGGRSLELRAEGVGLRIRARLGALEADVRVEQIGTPISVVSEMDGAGAPGATLKSAGLPASGWVSVEGRRIDLAGHSAAVDWTCARFGYRTDWNWASATGADREGRPFGLNLCRGVHDATRSTGHTENALWLDGRPAALPPVRVEVGRGGRDPWRIRGLEETTGARIELEMRPLGERREDVNLGVVASRFRQPFGTYHGLVRDREGRSAEVDGAVGVVEDHHARW